MNEIKNKKGDTVKVVLIIVLLILLIASMSFTVYDKFIKKENSNPTVTDKDKNNETQDKNQNEVSNLVKDDQIYMTNNSTTYTASMYNFVISKEEKELLKELVFPISYVNGKSNTADDFILKNFNVSQMSRSKKMDLIASNNNFYEPVKFSTDSGEKGYKEYDGYITEENFLRAYKNLYGVDVEYTSGNFLDDSKIGGCYPSDYDKSGKKYWYYLYSCGGDSDLYYYSLVTKVEKDNDLINVYLTTALINDDMNSNKIEVYKYLNYKDYNTMQNSLTAKNRLSTCDDNKCEKELDQLVKEDKLSVYRFTFKKQSDGRYYLYSGEWQ